jgi:lysophospholipase L1-like esterase
MPFYKKINDYWQVIDAGAFEGSSVYKNIDGEWTPMNSMWVKKDDTWVQVYQKPAFVKDRSKTIAFLGDEHIWGWNLKDSDCIDNIIQQNLLTVDGGDNRTNFHENSTMITYSLSSDDNGVYNYGYDGRSRADSAGTIYKLKLFIDEFDKNYTNTGVYSGFKGDKTGKTIIKNDWRPPEININTDKSILFTPSYNASRLNICTKGTFKAKITKKITNSNNGGGLYIFYNAYNSNDTTDTNFKRYIKNIDDFSKGKVLVVYNGANEVTNLLISGFSNLSITNDIMSQLWRYFKFDDPNITISNYKDSYNNLIDKKLANNPKDVMIIERVKSTLLILTNVSTKQKISFKVDLYAIPDVTGVTYPKSFDLQLTFIPTLEQPHNDFKINDGSEVTVFLSNKFFDTNTPTEILYDECESVDDGVKEFSLKLKNDNPPSELYLTVTSGSMVLKSLQSSVYIPINPASEQSSIQIQRIARKYYAVEDYVDDNVINEIKDNIMYKTYYDDAGIGNAVPTVVIQAGMNDIYRAHKKILNENGFLNKTMSDAEILDYTTNYFSNTYENNLRKLITGLHLTNGPNPHIPIVDVVLTVPFYPSNWFNWAYSTSNLNTAIATQKGSSYNNPAINYYDETGNGSIIPNYKLLFKLHDELKRITYQLANEYYLHLVDLSTVFLLPYHFQPDGLYLNTSGAVRVANKYIDDLGLLQTYDYAYTSDKNKREYIYYKRKI